MREASSEFPIMKIDAMDYDNPAARLLALLEEGKKLPNQGCRAAWDILLKTDGDISLLMSRLGTLYALPALILKNLQESFPAHVPKSAYWRTQVNKGFMSQNLGSDWSTFIGHIDEHTLNYLALTAEILQSKATTKTIADTQILEVRAQIEAIYKEVRTTDNLSSEIRTYLAHYLSKILNSIDEYFLTGAFPLLETTSALL